MKQMKKMLALVLATVMVMAMGSVAFAAGTNSITVNGTKEGEKLTIYKMFDLSVDSETNPTAFRYTVNSAWEAFFTTGDGADYIEISGVDGSITWKAGMDTDAKMIELGQKAAAAAADIDNVASKDADDSGKTTFDALEPGYYLITSSLGTKAIIDTTPTNPAPHVNEKNPEDTLDKTVKEDDTDAYGDENDVQVGDTVNFKTEVTLAPYTRNVKLYDTMTAGLSYNGDLTITSPKLTLGTDYTVEAPGTDEKDNPTTFTVTFTDDYLKRIEPDPATLDPETVTVTVEYSATVTKDAITTDTLGFATLENKTHLSFGDAQTSTEDKTTTKTYKFTLNKYANGVNDLGDAVFALKRNGVVQKLVMIDAKNYRIATEAEVTADGINVKTFDENKTIAELALTARDVTEYLITTNTGDIVIWGVDSDNNDHYTLQELKAPEGYNKLGDVVSVSVATDNSTLVDVVNNTGAELPSTGGVGTTVFYVVGSVLVLAAVVLLVTKRRMKDD